MKLEEVILEPDTTANRPAANAVPIGTLYYSTDDEELFRSDGTNWDSYAPAGATGTREIIFTVGNGTDVITTGYKGAVRIMYGCTILSATLASIDPSTTSGSIVIDIWKDTHANFPPTNADSITAAAPPTITTDTDSEDTTLTGWTTTITAGDWLGFNVDSVTSMKKVMLVLKVTT